MVGKWLFSVGSPVSGMGGRLTLKGDAGSCPGPKC